MSTMNPIVVWSGLVKIMTGVPYSLEIIECMLKAFTIAFEVSELMTDNIEPNPYKIDEGGGIRNARKTTGNTSCLRVCELNNINVSPDTNIGIVIA